LTDADAGRTPVINPVKDSMLTKTDPASVNIGYVVYYPAAAGSREHLMHILADIAGLLGGITDDEVITAVAESVEK
ncbi:MAG: hypothetical protein LC662_08815, partial [Rhodothermaceae bacterium]|nr:hypothetical protein [Rhodothermaceae bacterium]